MSPFTVWLPCGVLILAKAVSDVNGRILGYRTRRRHKKFVSNASNLFVNFFDDGAAKAEMSEVEFLVKMLSALQVSSMYSLIPPHTFVV
jgi:hypothetical protein